MKRFYDKKGNYLLKLIALSLAIFLVVMKKYVWQ